MKKSLFALAFTACFALGASELETLEKECNDGNMESCLRAALQYEDNTKTLKLLEKTCDGGYEPSCLVMSIRMMQENPKKGIEYHEKRCDAGDATYCGLLGSMYSDGDGVEKDISKAIIYHDKACNLGQKLSALSCSMLAEMYRKGDGVKINLMKAAVYDKKGCDIADELASCYNFALFNYNSNDKSKAARYYKKACDLGKNKNSPFMNPPEFKELWQKSCDMYELLK